MNRFYVSGVQDKGHITRDHGVVYKCDGSGRDTYIMYNNGGMDQPKYNAPGNIHASH